MTQAVEAVLDGFDTDRDIEVNALLCAMRQSDRGPEVADLVIPSDRDEVMRVARDWEPPQGAGTQGAPCDTAKDSR